MATPIDNTFNNVNGMNPIIFSKKVALAYTKLSNKVLDYLTNDYWEGDIKTQGDRVRIVVPNPDAISVVDGDTCPTAQGIAPEAMDLVIDKQKSFALAITDKEKAQTQFKNFIDGMAKAVAQKIGKIRNAEIIKAAFAYNPAAAAITGNQDGTTVTQYTPANHPLAGEHGNQETPETLTPATAYQFFLGVKMDLVESGAMAEDGTYDVAPLSEEPQETRGVIIIGTKLARVLLAAHQLTHATAAGDMVVKDGVVTRIAGMDVHIDRTIEDPSLNPAATGGNLPFLAGTKNAFTKASQISKVETLRDPYCFQDNVRGLELYGFKLVHPEALVRGVIDKAALTVKAGIPVEVVEKTAGS